MLATGAEPAVSGLPTAVAALVDSITPVRGQVTSLPGLSLARVVRGAGIYAAPTESGVVIGATMEPGRRDLEPDTTHVIWLNYEPYTAFQDTNGNSAGRASRAESARRDC